MEQNEAQDQPRRVSAVQKYKLALLHTTLNTTWMIICPIAEQREVNSVLCPALIFAEWEILDSIILSSDKYLSVG